MAASIEVLILEKSIICEESPTSGKSVSLPPNQLLLLLLADSPASAAFFSSYHWPNPVDMLIDCLAYCRLIALYMRPVVLFK